MRNVMAWCILAIYGCTPTPGAAQGLECLRNVQHGVSQSQATSRQALIAAQSDWETATMREAGVAYRWVLAMQTGRQVALDPVTAQWRAHVTAHPCRLRASEPNGPCHSVSTPAAAQHEGCATFYP